MVSCLQGFLDTGLVKSKFVNLKVRQLSAETCHDFIEWCGLISGSPKNDHLVIGSRLRMQELYFTFTQEYPDYAPRAKMSISLTRFYRWLNSYALFVTGQNPEVGRDPVGKWMIINHPVED